MWFASTMEYVIHGEVIRTVRVWTDIKASSVNKFHLFVMIQIIAIMDIVLGIRMALITAVVVQASQVLFINYHMLFLSAYISLH
jgi:hypothetical protein